MARPAAPIGNLHTTPVAELAATIVRRAVDHKGGSVGVVQIHGDVFAIRDDSRAISTLRGATIAWYNRAVRAEDVTEDLEFARDQL